MEINEIEDENFGKCVKISNGIIDAVVSIDFGPRILFFGFTGEANVFYTDPSRRCKIPLDPVSGQPETFYYYGGHRLWFSRERSVKTILPDNEPVVYSILPDSVRFLPPRPKWSDFQVGFDIIMGEDASDIMVVHTAKNCSREVRTCSLWPITMLSGNGLLILPQNVEEDSPFLPNRTVVYWPGTDIRDSRIFYGNRYLTVARAAGSEKALKIGCNNALGWSAFVGEKYTFLKRYVHNPQAAYPDFGCSCELQIDEDYTEIQTLSPVYRVEPDQGIRHVENLSLFRTHCSVSPQDESGITQYIDNLK